MIKESFKNIYYAFLDDLNYNYWMLNNRKSQLHGYVLMFHHVTDKKVDINKSCVCSISDFEKIIKVYQDNDYSFVSLDDAVKIIDSKDNKKFVAVTFDDIPDSVYANAYPILKKHRIPFAVFVSPELVGKDLYITRENLLILKKDDLCTIGAHSLSHPALRNSKNSWLEIQESKIELEEKLRLKVNYFAYPYGRHSSVSKKNRKEVKNAGFICAFCSIPSMINDISSNDRMFLPRIVPTTSVPKIKLKFTVIDYFISFIILIIKRIIFKG